jgi:hypothetical protein
LSEGQEARYRVIFLGPVQNDIATVNKVAQGLRSRFKLSDEAVTRVMKMASVAIKKEATLSEAQRYKEVLEAIGARVQLEPIDIESAQEAREHVQQTDEGTASLDREPQVIPVKAKELPPAPETAAHGANAGPHMVKCPQCGFEQEATDECIRCGVIISKFLKYQGEVKPVGVESAGSTAVDGTSPQGQGPQPQSIIGTPMEMPTSSTPWEDMANLGFFRAFFKTLTEVLFSPSQFFREMPVDKNIHYSLLYGIIMGFFVALSGLLWRFAFSGIMGKTQGMEGAHANAFFAPFFFIIYALILPLIIALILYVISGILHTTLMLVGGNHKGLDATFRVVAYTQSTQVFYLVPILGALVYLVYTPILLAIGFKESHQISTGKAVFAVLLPFIIAVIVAIIVVIMFVPLILSLVPQMVQQQHPQGF